MGFVAAGLAVAAVGAGVSAYGAAQSAEAMGDAYSANAYAEEEFYDDQSKKLNRLIRRKEDRLYNLGNIFDRFESTGAFGDTNTLKNLRQAQEDFSALAAGDFSGFESQLRKTMSDTLVNVGGSGAPIGTFAGLAADAQLNYRQQGIQTSVGLSEFLSNEANKLLGSEFGIMDQKFNTQYELGRTKTTNLANFNLGEASQVGVGTTAFGNAISQVGGALTGYGTFQTNQSNLNRSYDVQRQLLAQQQQNLSSASRPSVSSVPVYNTAPSFVGGMPPPRSSVNDNVIIDLPGETIYPSDPRYNSFSQPSPFSYGSGYTPTSPYLPAGYDGSVLPPLSNYSALGEVGRRIVA